MDETSPPAFSVHGVRYQVTDVGRAVAFYAELLGSRRYCSIFRPLPVCRWEVLRCCWVALAPRDPGRCQVANRSNRADGIEWFCESRTCQRESTFW